MEVRSREFRRILIVKPSSLGDIIHTLPLLAALRERFPRASLSWLVKREWAGILEGHPFLDEVIPAVFTLRGFFSALRVVRGRGFDCVVDPQGLFRSGLVAYLSGAGVRVGFGNGRELSHLFYTHKVPVPSHPIHAVDRYLLLAEELGAQRGSGECQIPLSPDDWSSVEELLMTKGIPPENRLVAIHPWTRKVNGRWPLERFAQVADCLNRRKETSVVFIGGADAIGAVDSIACQMETPCLSVSGQTSVKQVAALLGRVDLLLSADSGPVHIAAAMGTPVVALFGATDPMRTGPYGPGHLVIRAGLPCSPCLKKECYNPEYLACLKSIEVPEVVRKIEEVLERKEQGETKGRGT